MNEPALLRDVAACRQPMVTAARCYDTAFRLYCAAIVIPFTGVGTALFV